MEEKVLIILFICFLAIGCVSNEAGELNSKEIAFDALNKIIKSNDPTNDSIYVIVPFESKQLFEMYVSKTITPIHLYSDFEIDTIKGMKVLFSTGKQLKADTSYYQKSIDEGIVVLDKRIFWKEDQSKTFVIFQCVDNKKRKIFDLEYYEDNKLKIIESMCSE